jgi:hypothetical protein
MQDYAELGELLHRYSSDDDSDEEERQRARRQKPWHETTVDGGLIPATCSFGIIPKAFKRNIGKQLVKFNLSDSDLALMQASSHWPAETLRQTNVAISCSYLLYNRFSNEFRISQGNTRPFTSVLLTNILFLPHR